ncbi:hypothetical protein AVCANL283_07490 [Campylobacter canadensis]|uniref:Uncharacterized protein n=1 Tax=Campylobacter canadensis TaxID=449520 RepID=A0ABS7WU67_9BACT|nr:hypothetical protein [Campylobacter canadensis]MBZ7987936.1 hypothetical protein [Campylobacter canadensis]
MANLIGFNAIINTIRSQHTDSMETITTENTDTKYSTKNYFSTTILSNGIWGISKNKVVDKSSSTTTVNTQTTINNVFTIKGVLALIGRENQTDGEEYDFEIFEQDCIERYNCVRTLQNVYWSNQELKLLAEKHKNYERNITIGFLICAVGNIASCAIFFFLSKYFYKKAKNNENNAYEMLASMEPDLKALVEKFGEGLFDVYQLSPYITLKHVGE